MISLDQILVLEQKVESAVGKIQQLEAENDALRNKCSELTNALSAKTEQLAAYESDQKKIESGIIKAIDRLNSIENSVLKAAGQSGAAPVQAASPAQTEPAVPQEPVAPVEPVTPAEPVPEPEPAAFNTDGMNFENMEPVEDEDLPEQEPVEDSGDEPESKDELGFDIF
ncbi:MAG: cell division protein ZapB [Treponema sp.]|nr:cell division protein ZapB [Treponema sp.]